MRIVFLLTLSFVFSLALAQEEKVLPYNEYIAIVLANHPIAQQAELKLQIAERYQQKAKGSLDPKLFADANQKYFEDKKYYSLIDAGLKVPTWIGIDIKAGIEQNEGVFLSNQNRTPDAGLWYAGVEVPLGKGLFIDERRTAIKQAKILLESSELERNMQLSELVFNAGSAYWSWFESYHQFKTFEEAIALAQFRLDGVIVNAELGEMAFIDTLEAGLIVQNRQVGYQEALTSFQNASEQLNVFLWLDGSIPMEIDSLTIPIAKEDVAFPGLNERVIDSTLQNHTYFQLIENKLEILDIEQRYRRDQLKPELTLNYNALAGNNGAETLGEYNSTDYKWGINFEIPLFLRKERAELNLNRIKIIDTELEFAFQRENVETKVNIAKNNYSNAVIQSGNYSRLMRDYSSLLDAENTEFLVGESTVFMVNSREVKYIDAQLKYLESLKKAKTQMLKLDYVLFNF